LEENNNCLRGVDMDDYQRFIHISRYAKWLDKERRRETWEETVDRYINYWKGKFPKLTDKIDEAKPYILNLEVMPSMRAMMTAGEALDRDNVAGYNCSYVALNRVAAFPEIMYILMCGTGVGFSVERKHIDDLPKVAEDFHDSDIVIDVSDSRIGWARGYKELLALLYAGQVPKWDLSKIRPKGAPLKTFGGRASGPEPLDELMHFTCGIFKKATGRRLNSVEVHDIVCKIAEIVIVGGVRRSALISLSNLSDRRHAEAKIGRWYEHYPHRGLSNNSACYTEKPDILAFMDEWRNLIASKCGERGIFNRKGIQTLMPVIAPRRDPEHDFGTNPCSEIILRDREFCNLTEIVAREKDTLDTLIKKAEVATLLGTLQSTLTNFRFLSKHWKENCVEERLLGVSISGWMDNRVLSDHTHKNFKPWLNELREHVIVVNKKYAKTLGVNQSVATTCVKPSGTVSQLVDCASGIHPRHAAYYIRNVRLSDRDPLCPFLQEQGIPCEVDPNSRETMVFSFPIAAPKGGVTKEDRSALEQLEHWMAVQNEWCEHKPSISVYVREDEWMEVGDYVYKNFDYMSGVSFFPHDDNAHIYQLPPYMEVSKKEYDEAVKKMPKAIDWDAFSEVEDATIAMHELACVSGVCEI
jgi:ribonucleoside-triphosphate reductase